MKIKVRAWDKINKKMLLSSDKDFVNNFKLYANGAYSYMGEYSEEWLEILQFTGLKDKNEKEIYDGDIFKVVEGGTLFGLINHYCVPQPKIGDIYIVCSMDSGFMAKTLNAYRLGVKYEQIPNITGTIDNYSLWNGTQSIEVIGNIYENPELLN